ncbi:four helix bundle protein [Nitrospira sp. M1]
MAWRRMHRATVSIPSNIAEGFNRRHNKEYRQFLYIALGLSAELETQIEVSGELQYFSPEQSEHLLEKLDHEIRKKL